MIKAINHFTVNVVNRKESDDFYSDFFGFQYLESVDMGDSFITYYALPGGVRLELIDSYGEESRSTNGQCTRGCYRHLAFEVDSLDDYYKRCAKLKIPVIMEPVLQEKLFCRAMLIQDPNGVEIELTEKCRDIAE